MGINKETLETRQELLNVLNAHENLSVIQRMYLIDDVRFLWQEKLNQAIESESEDTSIADARANKKKKDEFKKLSTDN